MSKHRKYAQSGAVCLAIGLLVLSSAHASGVADPSPEELSAWTTAIGQTPLPFNGCFHASYPDTTWSEVPCGPATDWTFINSQLAIPPKVGQSPRLTRGLVVHGSNTVEDVGGTNTDWMASGSGLPITPTGVIRIAAAARFQTVSGVTSEYDTAVPGGTVYSDDYSVQLNSNYFSTPACAGTPGCQGWAQFIYSVGVGGLLMQFWLTGASSCPTTPSGWMNFGLGECKLTTSTVTVPALAASSLGTLSMNAFSSSGDGSSATQATLTIGTNAYATSDPNTDTVDLKDGWSQSEFNVFGDGSGRPVATFNSGSSITIYNSIYTYSPSFPLAVSSIVDSCDSQTTTLESNNTNLSTCTATPGGHHGLDPYQTSILFTETK